MQTLSITDFDQLVASDGWQFTPNPKAEGVIAEKANMKIIYTEDHDAGVAYVDTVGFRVLDEFGDELNTLDLEGHLPHQFRYQ